MGKIIAASLFISAFFFALYLLLRRQTISDQKIASAGPYSKVFLLAALSMLAFLTGCPGGKGSRKDTSPTPSQAEAPATAKVSPTEQTPAWLELSTMWQNVIEDLKKIEGGDESKKVVDKLKDAHGKAVDKVVAEGLFDKKTGESLDAVYSTIADHYWRGNLSYMKCYEPSHVMVLMMDVKQSIMDRVSKLDELSEKGAIEKKVVDKVMADISRDVEFLKKMQYLETTDEDHEVKIKKIEEAEKIYKSSKHVIAKTDPSFKVAELIVKLVAGAKK